MGLCGSKPDPAPDAEAEPTQEEVKLAMQQARAIDWSLRSRPATYTPVQIMYSKPPVHWLDWWSPRSRLFSACFPFMRCLSGRCVPQRVELIDITDIEVWKEALSRPARTAPETLQGVWLLRDNIAHENLVNFNDADWVGNFSKAGTAGVGTFRKNLWTEWTRDDSCFGWILQAFNAWDQDAHVYATVNLTEGKMRLNEREWVFRVDEDEWWKTHWPGDGEDDITYMYRWLKVVDRHGKPTKHWDEFVRTVEEGLPHTNAATGVVPCWPIPLPAEHIWRNAVTPNRKNILVRTPTPTGEAQGEEGATPML